MMQAIEKYYREPLYRNSIAIMLNTASGAIFGFLFWIVAARSMSSVDVGFATAIISVGTLITTLSKLGMDNGLIRFLPKSNNKDDLYSTTLIMTLAISTALTCVFIVLIDVLSPSLSFIKTGLFPLIVILYVTLNSINSIQNNAFIALRRGDLSFLQNLILGIRIPLLLYVAFLGVTGTISSYVVALLLTFIFGLFVIHKLGVSFKFRVNIEALKETLGFSLGNYTASIFSIAPSTIIPIMIVNTIGANNSAYFSIAYSIAGALAMIASSIGTSLFVEGSHNLPLKENVIKSYKFIFILLVPAVILILLFGDKVLLIFNKEYAEQAFPILRLLTIATVFSAVTSIYISIKRIQKDIKAINILNFTASVLIIILGYLFLKIYGLSGIGYAWLITNAIICFIVISLVLFKEKWVS